MPGGWWIRRGGPLHLPSNPTPHGRHPPHLFRKGPLELPLPGTALLKEDPAFAPLGREFFARDADVVARDLLGRLLVKVESDTVLAGRIVETEAYFGPPGANPQIVGRDDISRALRERIDRDGDAAAHSFRGRTERNATMFGEAGHAYVYLIYGAHECMNVSTGFPGRPQAVLLRALEPVLGERIMDLRRRERGSWRAPRADRLPTKAIASGPGKLTQALGITRGDNGRDLTEEGAGTLYLSRGTPIPRASVGVSARIGVVGAEHYPLRFFADGCPSVSTVPRTKRAARAQTARQRATATKT